MAMNERAEEASKLRVRHLLLPITILIPLVIFSSCANENLRIKPELGIQVWDDTIEARINEKYEIIWRTVSQALEAQGNIIYDDSGVGRIEADIHDSRVIFWLKQIERTYGQIRIRAYQRESFDPNLSLAYQIYEEVNLILNQ